MKARVTKEFRFAVGGNHVIDVKPGTVVEGRCAEVAIAQKWGEPVPEGAKAEAAPPHVMRLPLLEEYVAAGYKAEDYEGFIEARKAAAKRDGIEVEVRAPTDAELADLAPKAPAGEAEKVGEGKKPKGKK